MPASTDAGTSALTERIKNEEQAARPQVLAWRRALHAAPEVAWEEHATTELVCEALGSMGVPFERPLATGCVATIRGGAADAYGPDGSSRRRLLMRADIDALPVSEQTGLACSSRNDGCMHACGHDIHAAALLGVAQCLAALTDELHGEVRLVFQPAEEVSEGAVAMVRAGVCDGVDAAYGMHVWSDVPGGRVNVEAGPRMANTDWFRVDVRGASAHGAMPHLGTDAIVAAAAVVQAIQTVASRVVSPFEPVVVTVGQIQGGTANNVICDHVWMRGTIRCFDENEHARILSSMEKIVGRVAAAHGCEGTFALEGTGSVAVVNDEACATLCAESARKVLGADALAPYEGSMPGEDFSEYLREVPGVFAFVGAGTADADGIVWPQHSAHYSPSEDALRVGVLLGTQFAIDFLSQP